MAQNYIKVIIPEGDNLKDRINNVRLVDSTTSFSYKAILKEVERLEKKAGK